MSAGHEKAEGDQFNRKADDKAPLFRRMTPLGSCKSPLLVPEFAPPNTLCAKTAVADGKDMVPRLVLETYPRRSHPSSRWAPAHSRWFVPRARKPQPTRRILRFGSSN